MKPTDIRVCAASVKFSDVPFRTPLLLSTGAISAVTYARINVEVENRGGAFGYGRGGVLLSDLWSFPSPVVPHAVRDSAMRMVAEQICALFADDYVFFDAMQIGHRLEQALPGLLSVVSNELDLAEPLPLLAGLLCMAPVDAAIHDAWGNAAGGSSYEMYNADCLNEDLGHYLGPELAGRFPNDFLTPPRHSLLIQHAVGANDKLRKAEETADDPQDGLPNSLESWIERDRIHWCKLKLTGKDIDWDLQRLESVHRVTAEVHARLGTGRQPQLEGDPNEACASPDYMVELLERLRDGHPETFDALRYIEQPTPRRLSDYDYTLHEVSRLKPVIIDESLDDLGNLPLLDRLGWSGIALKACKGQTHTLLAYCWARHAGKFVTIQDLTNPGLSFLHSAQLARRLQLSVDCFEYNSRQYAPWACPEERRGHESLFTVTDGAIRFPVAKGNGIY